LQYGIEESAYLTPAMAVAQNGFVSAGVSLMASRTGFE